MPSRAVADEFYVDGDGALAFPTRIFLGHGLVDEMHAFLRFLGRNRDLALQSRDDAIHQLGSTTEITTPLGDLDLGTRLEGLGDPFANAESAVTASG